METSVMGLPPLKYLGAAYKVTRTEEYFRISAETCFIKTLTNPQELAEGGTMGDWHKKQLHLLLDEWIDNAIQPRSKA